MSGLCGSLGKMAKGVEIGAHGVNTGVTQESSLLMSRCPCSDLFAGDAGCGAEFESIKEAYSVRELAVSCSLVG